MAASDEIDDDLEREAPPSDDDRGATALDPRRRGIVRWRVLVPLFFLGGMAWSFMTAPMGVADEPAYAVHAVALWSGQWSSDPSPQVATPRPLPFGRGRWYQLPDVWTDGYYAPACFAFRPEHPATCADFKGSTETTAVADTLSYTVQPAWLVVAGLPGRLFPGLVGMYGMRLASSLAAAVLLAAAVRALADVLPARLALTGVLASITPIAYSMIGSVNPNGLEIASAVCFWAHALALGRRRAPTRHLLVGLVASATVLALSRPLSPIYLAGIGGIAAVAAGATQLGALWRDRRARLAGAAVVVVDLLAIVPVVAGSRGATADSKATLFRLSGIRTHFVEAFATFGWNDTPVRPVAVVWGLGLAGLALAALVLGSNRSRVALLLTLAAAVGLLLIHAVPGAGGWQGRYGLPLIVGIPLTAVIGIGDGWTRARRLMRWMLPALAAGFGLATIGAFVRALQRFTVGIRSGKTPLDVFHGDWKPPGGAAFPLLLIAAFAALSFVAVLRADDGEPEAGSEPTDQSGSICSPSPRR